MHKRTGDNARSRNLIPDALADLTGMQDDSPGMKPEETSRTPEKDQTRRRFGGRQPLWGIGVVSRIVAISRPEAESARMADSRPEPGPFT